MLHVVTKDLGWIEVITGSMFSGKSEELIRRLRRAQIAQQEVAIFKPEIDTRFSSNHIVSHNEQRIPSIAVKDVAEIFEKHPAVRHHHHHPRQMVGHAVERGRGNQKPFDELYSGKQSDEDRKHRVSIAEAYDRLESFGQNAAVPIYGDARGGQ